MATKNAVFMRLLAFRKRLMNVILKGEKSVMKVMKLKRKLLAGLLTLCMAVGMAVPAFAANGPSSGDMSAAWVQLYDSSVEEPDGYVLYSNGGEADTVEGAVYDKATNTITLTNYNHPEMTLATNEMGDDLKLHLVGDNHIAELVVWGFGWGGNLEITGDGSLTINENKTSQTAAIRFMAEGTQGLLKVGSNASVTAYKSAGENTYSAAFVSTTSSTLPFTGNLETELALTANSGIEGETTEWENVIYESNYVAQDWKVLTKGEDGKKYGVNYGTIYTGSDLTNGKPVGYIHELVKVEGLPSQKEYLAVQIATVDGLEKDALPEGYTDSGETISAKIGDISSMTVLIKDGQRFYWGVDPNHSQWLVYQTAVDDVTAEDWGQTTLTKIVVPVAGEGVSGATEEDIPAGYTTNVVKTGMYSYYCTNDVIKVSPSGTSTDPDELPFQDVRNGDWFYDSVIYVYGHGLMTGLNDTTFGPGEPLARAQLAVILYRLSGSPEVTYEDIFPDVPDGQWYTDAVIWAQEKGIVTGYSDSGTFKPGNNINRQEITTMMYRYAKYQGYSLEGGADYSSYPDAANVQEFAKDSMSWAVGNGIVTGKENPTRLDPLGNTARAECATIMMRFVEKFGK